MKKIITLISVFVLSLSCLFMFSGCNVKPSLDDGVLTVGYTIYPPMNYFEDDAKSVFVGFDTELAKEVGKILEVEIEFKEIVWDNKVTALNTYEIDCVWNGMTITEELQEAMAITDAYLENKQVIICQSSVKDSYTSKESINNASEVLVEAGSAGENVAKEVAGFDTSKLLTLEAQRNTILEVKTSSSKIGIIDMLMAKVLVGPNSTNSDLDYVDVDFPIEYFGIGFRKKDTPTRDLVNDAIKQLKENGKFDELLEKYYS